ISLGPLSDDDCAALIAELLEGSPAAAELAAPVLAVAGGNPLVVEEVLAMLIDDGALTCSGQEWLLRRSVQEIRIPPTIEAILGGAARRRLRRDRRRAPRERVPLAPRTGRRRRRGRGARSPRRRAPGGSRSARAGTVGFRRRAAHLRPR